MCIASLPITYQGNACAQGMAIVEQVTTVTHAAAAFFSTKQSLHGNVHNIYLVGPGGEDTTVPGSAVKQC